MNEPTGWRKWFWFLRSRKAQAALVTVVATILADRELEVSPEVLAAIVAVGASLILGIAHEDNGRNRNGSGGWQR